MVNQNPGLLKAREFINGEINLRDALTWAYSFGDTLAEVEADPTSHQISLEFSLLADDVSKGFLTEESAKRELAALPLDAARYGARSVGKWAGRFLSAKNEQSSPMCVSSGFNKNAITLSRNFRSPFLDPRGLGLNPEITGSRSRYLLNPGR